MNMDMQELKYVAIFWNKHFQHIEKLVTWLKWSCHIWHWPKNIQACCKQEKFTSICEHFWDSPYCYNPWALPRVQLTTLQKILI